ncbi:MAG: ribonuclease P protein component [Phycisphaeraceae bacterium]|nr:ribonuclease P protein component [Phycisphaeraceae bacterium]
MPQYPFRRRHRLSGRSAFAVVFASGLRCRGGPLRFHGRVNGLEHWRLGLSVSRQVGISVVRHHIKRLLREAFRLSAAELPLVEGHGCDLVIVVRAHETQSLAEYRRLLVEAGRKLARQAAN